MRKLALVTVAGLGLVTAACAQVPQGLGAADPSQQLKTSGMTYNAFQQQALQPTRPTEQKDLVTGAEAAGDANTPGGATAAPAAPANAAPVTPPADTSADRHHRKDRKHRREAEAAANAQAAATVPAAPANATATTATGANAWNPASAPAAPVAAAGDPSAGAPASDAHLQRIQDLIGQIKARRTPGQ